MKIEIVYYFYTVRGNIKRVEKKYTSAESIENTAIVIVLLEIN